MARWPAVITTDARGRVTSWNAEAEHLYGWPAAGVLGRRIGEIAIGPAGTGGAAILREVEAGRPWQGELLVRRRDGTRVPAFARHLPLAGIDGRVLGTVCTSFALDDPDAVPPEVAALTERSARADAVIDTLLWNAPVGLALLDTSGRFVRVNARLAEMDGIDVDAHTGRTALDLLPDLPRDEIIRDFETVIGTGTAVVDRDLQTVVPSRPGSPRYWVVNYYPARVGDGPLFGIGLVVADITERRAQQAALAASESRLRLTIQAAGLTTWDWNRSTGELVWDEAHETLLGHRVPGGRSTFDEFAAQIHPDDRLGVVEAATRAVDRGDEYEHRYRLVRHDGAVRRILARGQLVELPDGTHMVGVLADLTETADAAERVVQTLESMTDAFFAVDREWRFTYVNRQAERLLSRRAADLLGRCLWDEFPLARESVYWREYHRAVAEGHHAEFTAELGARGWFEVRAHPSDSGLSVYLRDVTDRHRAEEAAEQARRRLAFLAEAALVLDASLASGDTLDQVARLCVPALGDTCLVDVFEDDGTVRVAAAAIDVERQVALHDLRRRWPPTPASRPPAARVRTTGLTEVFETFPDEMWRDLAQDDAHLRALRGLGLRAGVTVPLVARGHVVGAMSVGVVTDRSITPDDIVTLEELGRRAGLAIDNARQYSSRVEVARSLQSRLLPASLPEVPGLEVAARYVAAGDLEVGGDFYDLFPLADGRWVAVLGDVSGKGAQAASMTGLIRHTIRAVAGYDTRPGPIVEALNRAVYEAADTEEFCTVLVSVLSPAPAGFDVTLALGGHFPPVLVRRGEEPIGVGRTGPLVGAFPAVSCPESSVHLAAGDVLVAYTDGVVERRAGARMLGDEGLAATLRAAAAPAGPEGPGASAVADAVVGAVEAFAPEAPTDDLALLVFRVGG